MLGTNVSTQHQTPAQLTQIIAAVFQTAAEPGGCRGLRIYVSVTGGSQSEQFRCCFAMGKIRGTPRMRSHISVHGPTTKYFSNSFVFKTEIEKEGLPGDIMPALGAGGPEFKSRRPDQNISRVFFSLLKALFAQNPPVEFPQTAGLDSQAV